MSRCISQLFVAKTVVKDLPAAASLRREPSMTMGEAPAGSQTRAPSAWTWPVPDPLQV
jgi:hypothetical protein